jgi:hypothetical protein
MESFWRDRQKNFPNKLLTFFDILLYYKGHIL